MIADFIKSVHSQEITNLKELSRRMSGGREKGGGGGEGPKGRWGRKRNKGEVVEGRRMRRTGKKEWKVVH